MRLIIRAVRFALLPAALLLVLAVPGAAAGSAAADARRAAAVAWAVGQAGVSERGTSNRSAKIDRWERDMGIRPGQVWCGAYVHQAFLRAGVRLSPRLIDPDRSYADAVTGRRGLKAIPKSRVRPGDLLFFAFRPRLKASHIAIVRTRPRNGSVRTAEGNVGNGVHLQSRGLRFAVLAARVDVG